MKETHITVVLRSDNTLAEAWKELAKQFTEGGADKYQIGTMMTVFYLGAAQAYARIDGNAKSFPSFCEIMHDVHFEIDNMIGRELDVAGHA